MELLVARQTLMIQSLARCMSFGSIKNPEPVFEPVIDLSESKVSGICGDGVIVPNYFSRSTSPILQLCLSSRQYEESILTHGVGIVFVVLPGTFSHSPSHEGLKRQSSKDCLKKTWC